MALTSTPCLMQHKKKWKMTSEFNVGGSVPGDLDNRYMHEKERHSVAELKPKRPHSETDLFRPPTTFLVQGLFFLF